MTSMMDSALQVLLSMPITAKSLLNGGILKCAMITVGNLNQKFMQCGTLTLNFLDTQSMSLGIEEEHYVS